MKITREHNDDLNSILKIKIEKEDYTNRVDEVLKDYRRKARIDGFRPGKVPFGLINKMYRKPVIVEEVGKVLNESITKYFLDEKLNILGEPLPNENNSPKIDWDNQTEFDFAFDIAIAPEFDIAVSSKDKLVNYKIKITDELRNKYINNYKSRLGSLKDAEFVEEESLIKASIKQTDDFGNILEEGIKVDEATLSVKIIKDDKLKNSFLSRKKDESFTVNLKKAYPSDVELASILKIKKEEAELIKGHFNLTILSISNFEVAEENQEFYDKLFGKDVVKTKEEFNTKIDEITGHDVEHESNYRFRIDAREYYTKKFKKNLPEEFLKRWLKSVNKKEITDEQIEKEFDKFLEDLKWQLIKDKIKKDNDIKIEEKELMDYAVNYARMQFSQYYGITDMPEEQLNKYAHDLLQKEEEKQRIYNNLKEDKIFELIKATVKLDTKEISSEKFNKLFEK